MQPHELNIRHLAAVAAVAEYGSISAAARAIHLSQPAVTQGLARLEGQLGIPLFLRRPNGMAPTEAGCLLAARVGSVLRLIGTQRATATQIRAFLALAQEGSYSRAAASTRLSKASLHRAVADLSGALGVSLVERRGKCLTLTSSGHDAKRRFRLAHSEINAALTELAALTGSETGRIIVGAMPLARASLLPASVLSFHDEHPEIDIAIIEGAYSELVGALRSGHIDFMIGALRSEPENDLNSQELFRDNPILVARLGHPLVCDIGVSASELASYPWVVARAGTPLRLIWQHMFEQSDVPAPRVAVECGSAIMIRQLLMGSNYLSIVSHDQFAVELEAGLLAKIGSAPRSLERVIGVTTRMDWRPTPIQDRLVAILRQQAARLQAHRA